MKRTPITVDLDLDSFLDILTNVIGVMILVATVIALQLQQTTTVDLGRPILHDPPKNAKRIWLECRSGRIFEPDAAFLKSKATDAARQKYGNHFHWDLEMDWNRAIDYLNSLKLGNQDYTISLDIADGRLGFSHVFNAETDGGYYANAEKKENDFKHWLTENFSPNEHWFMVKLHRSGFESFAECRAIASELGYKIGWELYSDSSSTWTYIDPAPKGYNSNELVD